MQKKILLISRHAPYGSSTAKEALDAALAAAVYEQSLSLLFMDDGVFQLLKDQQAQQINQKNFSSILAALPFYDIENIYIHQESLKKRIIENKDLLIEHAAILTNEQISTLLNDQDHILSF
ncbi:MAG: sulfurtransferase TusC [Cellvibrio sp. 79]|nr:MAG: sulfurtransferase TusC [Cellvibrio sp. 79]